MTTTTINSSRAFLPCRSVGYVSNHIPLQIRYIKRRKEHLIVTCTGKAFHTYGISHFGLLSVSGLHSSDITCLTADAYHVYTACESVVYAWRRGTELKHTYRGHGGRVRIMLPFGAHLITVDVDGKVMIWDIKDESVYSELTFNNKLFEISAMLHPSTYINKVVFGSEQGEMQLWNVNRMKMIYSFRGWDSPITCLTQSPAVDVIAVGLNNGRIILHHLRFDETLMEFTQDWGKVTAISFRLDENPIMVTASSSGHLVFWDLEKRKVASQLVGAHGASVTGLVCLPGEPLMLTSSPDNSLKLWIFDMPDGGARLLRIREGHSVSPTYVRFHGATGHNILSCAPDATIRIFNTQTEQFNKSLGHASYNRKASKRRARGEDDPLRMPPVIMFTSEVTREKEWDNIAAIHEGIPMVTTWSYDKLRMGDLKLLPERFQKKHADLDVHAAATCLSLSHCGNFVIVGYNTGHVDRFNMQSGIWRDSYGTPRAHEGAVKGVASDPLLQVVITGGSDGMLHFWRFKCKGSDSLTGLNLKEEISFVRTHQESSMMAVALEKFTVAIVDVDTRRVVRQLSISHCARITDMAFSPDSRWLVVASMDSAIRLWDIPSGQLIDHFITDPCVSLTWSPTGEALATAHTDHLGIFLWTNRTLYQRVTMRAIAAEARPPLVSLPQCHGQPEIVEVEEVQEETDYMSPEQIAEQMITMSGLPTSRWLNLLNIDLIRQRNKPKEPPKTPKAAPFFLPTIPALDLQFDLHDKEGDVSKIKRGNSRTLSDFGELVVKSRRAGSCDAVIDKLKSCSPSVIEFEVRNLAPENGGSVEALACFLECMVEVLEDGRDFELAQAYLALCFKEHGRTIGEESRLRECLGEVKRVHEETWKRLEKGLVYSVSVVRVLKSM